MSDYNKSVKQLDELIEKNSPKEKSYWRWWWKEQIDRYKVYFLVSLIIALVTIIYSRFA